MKDNDKKIILPKHLDINLEDKSKTARTKKREEEDTNYVPVIIKRSDTGIRHPDDILEKAIHHGSEQYKRSNLSLLISSTAAGLILGFTAMAVAIAYQIGSSNGFNEITTRFLMALFYPLGFIICILSGTQLFTEQTATAVFPVLISKQKFKSLLKLWTIVLIGNLIGTFLSSVLITTAEPVIGANVGYLYIYEHLIHFNFFNILTSAILAGWLMAQGGWLILSSPTPSSQITLIYITTFIIGLGGLHHSIAGSAEVFAGLLTTESPNYLLSLKFIITAVLGNVIGGSIFVAILNYTHIRKTQE